MSLSVGDRLGPYLILSSLGAGGMGEVWKARDTRLDRIVAIKTLKGQHSARFEQEARAIAALNHPHICQIYDIGPDYLVLEYVEGKPLKGPLPAEQAWALARQIAAALEAAHAKGILHRDLKPGNILVSASGAKLLDFGLAKLMDDADATQTMGIAGTPLYMSPEQVEGKPLDTRSDIFSFGVVLYELLTGRRPFDSLAAVLRDDPAPSGYDVVAKCLAKRPTDRYASMAGLRALEQASASKLAEAKPSIAVLPFANLSSDKENEYFSDGLAEEILNALTTVPGLRVVARASTFSFRGRENAIKEIGDTLKVSTVLHGSVRRSGDRIRVNVQLIQVADESQLWSERYDRQMRDVFDIQDEIAQAIVEKLKIHLDARSSQRLVKRYTESTEVHSLYLKGLFHLSRNFSAPDLAKAKSYLDQVVALEPNHAPAWVQLTELYIAGCFFGYERPLDLWPQAADAASRAVAADPEYADAQAAMGIVASWKDYDWAEAVRRMDTAVRLNPASGRAQIWRSQTLMCVGREQEMLEAAQRAVELDPLQMLYRQIRAERLLQLREYPEAAKQAVEMLELDANSPAGHCILGEAYSQMGRREEGVAELEKGVALVPGPFHLVAYLSRAYVAAGRRADAERFVTGLIDKRRQQPIPAGTIARAMLGLGDVDGMMQWAEQGIEDRDPNLTYFITSPDVAPLRGNPRMLALLRKMNLGDRQ